MPLASSMDLMSIASAGFEQVVTVSKRGLPAGDRGGFPAPRWSPGGEEIAFLASPSAAETKRQVFTLPMKGGEARKVTNAPQGVQQFAWSPDGKAFAYVTADEA